MKWGWGDGSVVKHLPCKHGDLSSNPQNPYGARAGSASLQSLCSYSKMGGRVGVSPQRSMSYSLGTQK